MRGVGCDPLGDLLHCVARMCGVTVRGCLGLAPLLCLWHVCRSCLVSSLLVFPVAVVALLSCCVGSVELLGSSRYVFLVRGPEGCNITPWVCLEASSVLWGMGFRGAVGQ